MQIVDIHKRANNLRQNQLDAGFGGCKPYRKPRRKAPVTIVIGIACSNGIVIACDSRTTDPSGVVHDDAIKLNVIFLRDGNSCVVAESGNESLSSRAVEKIYQIAKSRALDDYREFAKCAESAVSELKDEIRKQYKGTSEELQKHFLDHSFELLIAHYFKGQPFFFTLDFVLGLATIKRRNYVSIGCGWQLADFIISRLDLSGFTTAHGMWTAVYAVEEIKKFDSRCGGPTRSAVIENKNNLSVAGKSEPNDAAMQEAVKEALEFSEESKLEWKQVAQERISNLISRRKTQLGKPS